MTKEKKKASKIETSPKDGKPPLNDKEQEEAKKMSEKKEKIRKAKLACAEKFKEEVLKKYQKMVKAVVLFGSVVRGDFTEKSDVDMLVIIDDVMARMSEGQKEQFDDEIRNIAKKIHEDVVVQPAWTLSEFWDMARIGHPLLFTIVRDGWALYDKGKL